MNKWTKQYNLNRNDPWDATGWYIDRSVMESVMWPVEDAMRSAIKEELER